MYNNIAQFVPFGCRIPVQRPFSGLIMEDCFYSEIESLAPILTLSERDGNTRHSSLYYFFLNVCCNFFSVTKKKQTYCIVININIKIL